MFGFFCEEEMMKKSTLSLPHLMVISALGGMNPCYAEIHDVVDPLFGPIGTFDDWGFPESVGREAFNFDHIDGFGPITLIQNEVTQLPDGVTQDPPSNVFGDFLDQDGNPILEPFFPDANMDSSVNLFLFGYTDASGSTFNNHQVDKDADHLIPKADMSFSEYDLFLYRDTTGTNPDQDFDTFINFEPFAMSDAGGWCVFQTHPVAAGEPMAGQVEFDFGFAVKIPDPDYGPTGSDMLQLIPGFQMRSYGTLVLDFELPTPGGPVPIHYEANAAPNNTDPSLGRDALNPLGFPSPDFFNHVSFMGGGVIPLGVWLDPEGDLGPDNTATRDSTLHPDQTYSPLDPPAPGEIREDGAIWHANSFGGFPFMLRADALRSIDEVDNSFYGTLDHDIEKVIVNKQRDVGKPVNLRLKVRNNYSVADGTTLATVVGHQDGVEIFAKSMIVPAIPSGNASTMVDFGSYTPDATGVITWTATITDADPDDDKEVETTQVK
jgi:hypothetical protein